MNEEEICEIGYINDQLKHCMISIKNPTLTNVIGGTDFIQLGLTIEGAVELRARLNKFLDDHGVTFN